LLVAALGVLAYDLFAWAGDDTAQASGPVDLDGDGCVDEDPAAGGAPTALAAAPSSDVAVTTASAGPGVPSADASPGVTAPAGDEPDWQVLLQQMLERADAESESASRTLTDLRLSGIASGPDGGLALIDGRCLRAGDEVPGTRYVVAQVHADHVLLGVAGRSEPVELLLGALGGR
ncbi:MAG: hypothetical protein FJ296_07625, partial [Planctomycetes bacterium]|nr:hypothetical protein [Planctomycetota bacterium]